MICKTSLAAVLKPLAMLTAIARFCVAIIGLLLPKCRVAASANPADPPPTRNAEPQVVRGYDTPELFRSDTLVRLRHMEDELAAQRARIEQLERRVNK